MTCAILNDRLFELGFVTLITTTSAFGQEGRGPCDFDRRDVVADVLSEARGQRSEVGGQSGCAAFGQECRRQA